MFVGGFDNVHTTETEVQGAESLTGEADNGGVVGGRDRRGEGAVMEIEAPVAVGGFHVGETDGAVEDDHAILVLDVVEGAKAGGVAAGEDFAIGAGEFG